MYKHLDCLSFEAKGYKVIRVNSKYQYSYFIPMMICYAKTDAQSFI